MKSLLINSLLLLLLMSAGFTATAQTPTQKAYMGVGVDTVSTALRKQYKLKNNVGIIVREVFANSPAQAAGIRVNDVIVQLNDSTVRASQQFVSLVQRHKVGETVRLTFYRDGKKTVQPVLLVPRTDGR
jgi:S1-C subfamily serine protease